MHYISTRGEAPVLGFEDVLLAGLAADGGLYVPERWPQVSAERLGRLAGRPYGEVAFAIVSCFTAEAVPEADLKRMIDEAYGTFGHAAVAPLRQIDARHWLLELFHGPTLAFKDVAMQLLARLMDWALEKRQGRATIVGATSGDTGGAAVEAFKDSRRASLFILHPKDRVSEVQRRQMTTVASPSVHNIAVDGTFDDCQALVKAMFNDRDFRERVSLAGVNSINWARIMAQIVYYFTAALALGAPQRRVSFTVPTGNFGDIFAGYAAKRMGLPVGRLVIATNVNDILDRALATGRYETRAVQPSASPSMDIQVSSNFERLLFEAHGRDGAAVGELMAGLAKSGSFSIGEAPLAAIRAEFAAGSVSEEETARAIRDSLASTGEIVDPHTAVGVSVARRQTEWPMVTLATAHPAKFPDAVAQACGMRPGLPKRLEDLLNAPERFTVLPNRLDAVKNFILSR